MAETARPRRSKPPGSGLISGLGLVAAALVLAAAALTLARERSSLFEQSGERQALLARVLEDHASRSLDTAQLALASIAEPAARRPASEVVQALLVQTQASLPFLRGVAVLDEGGRVLAAADANERGARIDPRALGPWPAPGREAVGPMVPSRNLAGLAQHAVAPPGMGFIPLLRTVAGPQGHSLLLVALLNPDALATFQQLTLADPDGAAALLSLDGQALAATFDRPSGSPAAPGVSAVRAGHDLGRWQGAGLRAGGQIGAWRALRGRALMVAVETDAAALQRQWLARAVRLGALALIIAMALLWLGGKAAAGARQREQSRRQIDAANARLRAREQDLRAQLGLARSLLASSPLPMSVLDRDNHYLDVNHAWEQFTGRQRDEVIGQPARSYLPPDQAAQHDARDAELLARGGEARYEATWQDRDGSTRELFISKSTFPGPDGQPAGIVVSFMDISEFREAERATRAARDAALDASQAKTEFIANVSHELRTPLQSILGFSELGQVRARKEPRLAEMFGDVHKAGQRMLALVNDLLDLSKIENAAERLHPERQDLRPLLTEVGAELRPLLDAKQLRLSRLGPNLELVALVDGARLQQVLRNVLANAIKFAPPGSVIELHAGLTGPADKPQIELRVADRGPGIPPAELERIFEAFVQSSATKDGSGGTGLGLAICRRIVHAHGGSIVARNRSGGGAELCILLPAARYGETVPAGL